MYIDKLSIPGKQTNELSYVFADELTEQENGSVTLFGLFDIKSGSELYLTILKETVKHFLDYYHQSQTLSESAFDELPNSDEFVFENAIQYTYEKVSESIREIQEQSPRASTLDMKRVNCILGALIHDSLFLSITGSTLSPLLFYPVTHKHGSSYVTVMNIAEQSTGSSDGSHRLFSNIISGKISIPSSSLILCNQTFLDYINPQQLKQVISNTPIHSIVSYFKNLLTKVNARNDFSLLLIARDSTPDPHHRKSIQTLSSSSMNDLNSTEAHTRSILTPTLKPQIKKVLLDAVHTSARISKLGLEMVREGIQKTCTSELKERVRLTAQSCGVMTWKFVSSLPSRIAKGQKIATTSIGKLKSPQTRAELVQSLQAFLNRLQKIVQTARVHFSNFSPLSRALFLLSALFICLFIASLLSVQIKNNVDRKDSYYTGVTAAIQQKIDSADASLIYDDKKRVKELLSESDDLLRLIDERYKSRKDYKDLVGKLATLNLRINNIVYIQSPTVLATLPQLSASAPPVNHLIRAGSAVIAYSQDSLYQFDDKAHAFHELPLHEKIPSIACGQNISENRLLFCNSGGDRLYTLALPAKTVTSSTLALGENESGDRIVKTYNDRLYVLTLDKGALFRHIKTVTGFSKGALWLKSALSSLAHARDFTIDGTVYALSSNGALLLFNAGKQLPQEASEQTKKLITDATRIWTDQGESRLYLLDPHNKKIIILDKKTLESIGQITSDDFQGLQDMVINTKKKEILLLDNGRLLKIPLSF